MDLGKLLAFSESVGSAAVETTRTIRQRLNFRRIPQIYFSSDCVCESFLIAQVVTKWAKTVFVEFGYFFNGIILRVLQGL